MSSKEGFEAAGRARATLDSITAAVNRGDTDYIREHIADLGYGEAYDRVLRRTVDTGSAEARQLIKAHLDENYVAIGGMNLDPFSAGFGGDKTRWYSHREYEEIFGEKPPGPNGP